MRIPMELNTMQVHSASTHDLSLIQRFEFDYRRSRRDTSDFSSATTHLHVLSSTNDTISALALRLEILISLIIVLVISLFANIAVCIGICYKFIALKENPSDEGNNPQANLRTNSMNREETVEMNKILPGVRPLTETDSTRFLRQSTPSKQSVERQHECKMAKICSM